MLKSAHLSRYEADELVGEPVGPGKRNELVPVPGHHVGDVERRREVHGDLFGVPGEEKVILRC